MGREWELGAPVPAWIRARAVVIGWRELTSLDLDIWLAGERGGEVRDDTLGSGHCWGGWMARSEYQEQVLGGTCSCHPSSSSDLGISAELPLDPCL